MQQMVELEARLAAVCGSPATPQVIAELEWLEGKLGEGKLVEQLYEQVSGII